MAHNVAPEMVRAFEACSGGLKLIDRRSQPEEGDGVPGPAEWPADAWSADRVAQRFVEARVCECEAVCDRGLRQHPHA